MDRSNQSLLARYALPPETIEHRSLSLVEATIGDRFADGAERAVATRVVYAAGDLGLAPHVQFSPGAVAAGITALRQGVAIVTDVRMVLSGISRERAGVLACELHCGIDAPETLRRARESGLPRAAEAMRVLAGPLNGGIAVIGNAPTALLSLLDLVDAGVTAPALIIGMPVGFVAAAESKEALEARRLPYLTIRGTRGGSPLAAAALNALLRLAAPKPVARETRAAILFVGHGSRAEGAAEAMALSVERVRSRGTFPIVEAGYLELASPSLPEALSRCIAQGARQVAVVPYFLHQGMHIRRDIPALLRREAERYPGVQITFGVPIGLQADLAEVMIAGARAALRLPDVRAIPPCTGACATGGPPQACCEPSRLGLPSLRNEPAERSRTQ